MKSIVLAAVLLGVAFSNQSLAQVKKKAFTNTAPVLNRIDFFSKKGDDAVQIITDELKKQKVTLTGIEDKPLYDFNITTNEKEPGGTSTEKTLYFNKGLKAKVTTFENDVVRKLWFTTSNVTYYTAIKKMLGSATWKKIDEKDNDTTYKNGVFFEKLSSSEYILEGKPVTAYDITVEHTKQFATHVPDNPKVFDIENMDIHTYKFDVTYAAINFIKKLGFEYLYKTEELHLYDTKTEKRYGTEYTAYFANGVSIDFSLNKSWLVNQITFKASGALAFYKLKKAFKVSNWQANGTPAADGTNSYTNKNVDCDVENGPQRIEFNIHPELSDIDTRFILAPTLTLAEILALRYSGNDKEVAKNITKNYLNKVTADKTTNKYGFDATADDFDFYFPSPSGALVNVYFKMALTPQWTAPFLVNSSDEKYLQALSDEFDASPDYKNYTKVLTTRQFRIHDNDYEATRRQNEAAKEEQARLDASEKERQKVEKERLKAEKDARTMDALNKLTEGVKQLVKKP